MKTTALAMTVSLLLGSSVVAAGTAGADPVTLSRTTVNDGYAKLHRYCDQVGRCWSEGHRNLLLATYDTIGAPPWFRKPVVMAKASRTKVASLKATKQPSRAVRDAQAKMR